MRAIITGSRGQDGYYLCESLKEDGWDVCEITRHAMILNGEEKPPTCINDSAAIGELIRELQPHQIYHLAAHNHSSEQSNQDRIETLRKNFQIYVDGFLGLLEGVARHTPLCRVFYAASSHVFGNAIDTPQTEKTLFNPINP